MLPPSVLRALAVAATASHGRRAPNKRVSSVATLDVRAVRRHPLCQTRPSPQSFDSVPRPSSLRPRQRRLNLVQAKHSRLLTPNAPRFGTKYLQSIAARPHGVIETPQTHINGRQHFPSSSVARITLKMSLHFRAAARTALMASPWRTRDSSVPFDARIRGDRSPARWRSAGAARA